MPLTRIERNRIFEAIAASDLDPTECTLEQNDNEIRITHVNSGSTFSFTFVGTERVDFYHVRSDVVDGHHLNFQAEYNIDSVTPWINSWANEVKEITDALDLWAGIRLSRELIAALQGADSSNTPFIQDEQRQIANALQEIKVQLVERFALTDAQMTQVNEKLDELVEASKHMGRKEWFIVVLGVLTALIVAAIVTPGIGWYILATIVHGIGHLFGGGPPQIET